MNQTLSALGKRHKGSFQRSLTSRSRAHGGEAITKISISHKTVLCPLRCTRACPQGLRGPAIRGGSAHGTGRRQASLAPGRRRSELVKAIASLSAPREVFSLPVPASAPHAGARVALGSICEGTPHACTYAGAERPARWATQGQ